jgi:hypothetical protein
VRFLILILIVLCGSSPTLAGKKDDAWAQCLWKNVPTTAANWLAIRSPEVTTRFNAPETPDVNLEYRLRASCESELTPSGKNRAPALNPKKVKSSLQTIRPNTIGADKTEPKAFRCDYFFEDDTQLKNRARFEWGYEDHLGRHIWSRTDFGFAAAKGGTVYLVQGGGIKKCYTVKADGSLVDA